MPAISLRGLSKRFGSVTVLEGIDLEVPSGSIYGLLGLNGAGKTTLLRLLMGFLRPSGGEGELLGRPLGAAVPAQRARLGYIPEAPALDGRLRVGELCAFVRSLQPRWDPDAARRYLEMFRLPADRRVAALSAGMRSQLALALALAGQPELLLIDEPAAGLDPVHRRRYLQLLLEEGAVPGRTIVLASQDLALVERACDHVALLHDRRIQVAGSMEEVVHAQARLRVLAPPAAEAALTALPGARLVMREGHGFLVTGAIAPADVRRIAGVSGVQAFTLSLEDLFWSYVAE